MDILMIDDTQQLTNEQQRMVHQLLDFAADYIKLPEDTEMSLTFTDNQAIQEINRDYRGIDRATDVISFALEEESEDELPIFFDDDMEQLPRNIGDIFISVDKTMEQAKEYGHSFERELGFLAIHGFLHLNGYDHMNPEDETKMFSLQNEILNEYGLSR